MLPVLTQLYHVPLALYGFFVVPDVSHTRPLPDPDALISSHPSKNQIDKC